MISRVRAPLFVADSPVRADLQNIQRHNSKYGCNVCEVKQSHLHVQGEKKSKTTLYVQAKSKIPHKEADEKAGKESRRKKS